MSKEIMDSLRKIEGTLLSAGFHGKTISTALQFLSSNPSDSDGVSERRVGVHSLAKIIRLLTKEPFNYHILTNWEFYQRLVEKVCYEVPDLGGKKPNKLVYLKKSHFKDPVIGKLDEIKKECEESGSSYTALSRHCETIHDALAYIGNLKARSKSAAFFITVNTFLLIAEDAEKKLLAPPFRNYILRNWKNFESDVRQAVSKENFIILSNESKSYSLAPIPKHH